MLAEGFHRLSVEGARSLVLERILERQGRSGKTGMMRSAFFSLA